jgi:hypothetical protein
MKQSRRLTNARKFLVFSFTVWIVSTLFLSSCQVEQNQTENQAVISPLSAYLTPYLFKENARCYEGNSEASMALEVIFASRNISDLEGASAALFSSEVDCSDLGAENQLLSLSAFTSAKKKLVLFWKLLGEKVTFFSNRTGSAESQRTMSAAESQVLLKKLAGQGITCPISLNLNNNQVCALASPAVQKWKSVKAHRPRVISSYNDGIFKLPRTTLSESVKTPGFTSIFREDMSALFANLSESSQLAEITAELERAFFKSQKSKAGPKLQSMLAEFALAIEKAKSGKGTWANTELQMNLDVLQPGLNAAIKELDFAAERYRVSADKELTLKNVTSSEKTAEAYSVFQTFALIEIMLSVTKARMVATTFGG